MHKIKVSRKYTLAQSSLLLSLLIILTMTNVNLAILFVVMLDILDYHQAEELTSGGVRAIGQNTETIATVSITISDENDNRPLFNADRLIRL